MFAPRWSRTLGCLLLPQPRVRACEATRRWPRRAGPTRLCGLQGGQPPPGTQPEVHPAGCARRQLREWTLAVSPFGQLRARLPCHLTLSPLDPLRYPDGDRVLIAVSGVADGAPDPSSLQVQYDEAQKEVTILSDTIDPHASVEVHAPLKFGK